ncbi:MAG: serine hydrolase domain-containing protein, partial [Sphingobacterium sp.]
MSRKILFILFSILSLTSYGQSKTEAINRAVFNKVEFFINTQLTDSIYSLASNNYKDKISADQLAYTLSKVYQLGRIRNVQVVDFNKNTATYSLEFDQYTIDAKFAVDSTYHFELLSFLSAQKTTTTQDSVEAPLDEQALSDGQPVSATDFYIDSIANTYIANGSALTIAIFHQNKYKSFDYGETKKGNGTLPTDTTLYEIGSLTKVFTAILLADLVTKEIVSLDDPIAKFLPDSVSVNTYIQGITFKQLANHTSGLPRMASNTNEVAGFDE